MSIDDKNNEKLEEDTAVSLRAVSGGNRKHKKHKQTRISNQSSNINDSASTLTTDKASDDKHVSQSSSEQPSADTSKQDTKEEKDQAKPPAASEQKAEDLAASSAPIVPRRPQAGKEPSAPVVPKRPQGKQEQAASVIPRRPQARKKEVAAFEQIAKEQSVPTVIEQKAEVQSAATTTRKDIADMSTAAISKQEVQEQLAVEVAKKALAEQARGATPQQGDARKDLADLPTTAMPAEQKAPEKKAEQPSAPAAAKKDIADMSTAAISKQEVQEQLAIAKAKKELAEQARGVIPQQKSTQKDVAELPTTAMPAEQKAAKQDETQQPATPVAEQKAPEKKAEQPSAPDEPKKDIADISTTAISKKEVEQQLAIARAQKEAANPPVPTHPEPGASNGEDKKAVAVLTRPPVAPRVPAPSHLDPMSPHRARVNRILMRKKRHERTKELAPRLVLVVSIVLIVLTSLFSAGAGAAYAYYQSQLPLLNGIADHSLFQSTRIYDRNGKLLYELYDQQLGRGRRTYVNYKDISPLLVDATVAIEDRSFWTNEGVDPIGIARASFALAQSGDVQGGGSTVTQQLIKKQLFDNQPRTFPLKMEEALLASGLTQQYPKWKIMEMYLNTVYYGDINYGIEAAAQDYFGLMPKCDKTRCIPAVAQLDLAQASMLAGLPQSPTNYSPIDHRSDALTRQKAVLQAMVETGKVTQQQAQKAADEMAKYTFISHFAQRHGQPQAPHFVNYVIDQLTNLLGAQTMVSGGFNVYTTLDLDLEKKVEQIVYNRLYQQQSDNYVGFYGILSRDKNIHNGAVVVMNPYNGEILAMDGSANYKANNPELNGQVDAALAMRQPGSSMKPIVYATAFEMGWSPGMIVPDHKTTYPYLDGPNKYYTPQNYDQTFHTSFPMTIRTAVSNSYNIPAIDTLMYAGIPNVLNMAGRLGLPELASLPADKVGAAMALGAKEVSLLHLTNAYATFANQGVHVAPTSILEITDNQGRALYKYNESHPQGTQATTPDVAFLINSMLSDKAARYHEFSPGNPLEFDRPVAAKTGTTDNFKDNWTMGYTPHLAVGVWVGNSDNEDLYNAIGITGAGPIFHDVMQYANQRYNFPSDDFIRPKNVHAGTVSAVTGLVPRPGEQTVTDWYIDGTLPTIQGSNYSAPASCSGKKCKNNNNNNDNNGGNNNN